MKKQTISVVLPCAGEEMYAQKTVQAVLDTTPAGVLAEETVKNRANPRSAPEQFSVFKSREQKQEAEAVRSVNC